MLRHNHPYVIVIDSHCLSKRNLVLEGKLKGGGEGRVLGREASLNAMSLCSNVSFTNDKIVVSSN